MAPAKVADDGRATAVNLCEGIRLRCLRAVPCPFLCEYRDDNRGDACDWDSLAFLQLRRFFSLGIHNPAVYFPAD